MDETVPVTEDMQQLYDEQGHVAFMVTNMPPTEIICACGERFVGDDPIAAMKAHRG